MDKIIITVNEKNKMEIILNDVDTIELIATCVGFIEETSKISGIEKKVLIKTINEAFLTDYGTKKN